MLCNCRSSLLGRSLFFLAMTAVIVTNVTACRSQETPRTKARGLIREADKAYQANKFDEAAKAAKAAAELQPDDAEFQQTAAQILFLSGKVDDSLVCFDKANKLNEMLAPHNWQRGCALGCAGRFAEGAEQFGMHHDVNPNDVENSAWYFLCVAKSKSLADAQKSIIGSSGDRREPMMSVLKMLQGTIKPDEVLVAAKTNTKEGPERKLALFYGFLYVALYYDSIGEGEKAAAAMDSCIEHAEKDYMGRTAQIYKEQRFAKSPPVKPADSNSKEK